MMPKKFTPVISIVLLQVLFIFCLISFHLSKINSGTRVLLETEPVDPLSVFRGRYIQLNYKISSLPSELLEKGQTIKRDDIVYVALEKKEKYWQPAAIYKTKPKGENLIFLRGKVSYTMRDKINLNYGIESFFLSETSADIIEQGSANRFNWREEEKRRQERINKLTDEDKIIYKSGANEWWIKTLNAQSAIWVKENIVNQEQAQKIREKYAQAWARINAALKDESEASRRQPLDVEVAVTKEGRGYPARIFWQGKEYR
jgi:uncharacterized membrane-anchored protein